MNDTIIEIENLSKRYRIGRDQARYGSLRESLATALPAAVTRFRNSHIANRKTDILWALKDVSLEVRRGDVVGIVGRNGAGKSTLLKILSQITKPTNGRAIVRGRVGSLLEVGTGFHPELTGRENIYLNGAILGMKRVEIQQKFDEIVAFAEIEQFLDTPVKRFSSGMYMRLAFAVAAHLNQDILVVDEVLAVGDASFQKKCLGKMGELASEGRTVLFVSHNMAAIMNLCNTAVLLETGRVKLNGAATNVVRSYLNDGVKLDNEVIISSDNRSSDFRFCAVGSYESGDKPTNHIALSNGVNIKIEFEITVPIKGMNIAIHLWNNNGICVLSSTDIDQRPEEILRTRTPGKYSSFCQIPPQYLRPGLYHLGISSSVPGVRLLAEHHNVISFEVWDTGTVESKIAQGRQGVIAPALTWKTRQVDI